MLNLVSCHFITRQTPASPAPRHDFLCVMHTDTVSLPPHCRHTIRFNTQEQGMSLKEQQKRDFRSRGHHLKPVVTIGNAGLTDAVIRELDLSLEHHELMKVRISGAGRDERRRIIDAVCEACDAEAVQAIGNIALLYRKARNP